MRTEPTLPLDISVLLVEDNEGDARLVQEYLKEGAPPGITFQVTRVAELTGALEQFQSMCFDVILLDLWLPDSVGVRTVTRVRRHCKDTPLIVLTGNTDQHVGVEALDAGAKDFFVKGRVDSFLLAKALLRQAKRTNEQELGRSASGSSVRVLVVEDSLADARLLDRMLREPIHGVTFDVTRVIRLSEARALITETRFDVILLDLWLPDSSGVQTVTQMRQICGDTPVIVITGGTDEHIGAEALLAGAQDFLVKGTVDAQLLSTRLLRQLKQGDVG